MVLFSLFGFFRFVPDGGVVELLGFVQPPTRPLDVDDDGVVAHAIHNGRGDHGVPEVVPQGLEVDIRSQPGGVFPIACIDDLEEQGGVACAFLLQTIKAKFVNLC